MYRLNPLTLHWERLLNGLEEDLIEIISFKKEALKIRKLTNLLIVNFHIKFDKNAKTNIVDRPLVPDIP